MSVRRLLHEMDSQELTQWTVFLAVKHEREDEARERAGWERRVTGG